VPIYEYWCVACRAGFEKLRPMGSKDADVQCPKCGSPVKRMLSVVAPVGRASAGEQGFAQGGGCACGGNCGCRN
jgi:putative FmdB family regulatory protein